MNKEYKKPKIKTEPILERVALACGKLVGSCSPKVVSSS